MLSEILSDYGLLGLSLGLCTFIVIGLFHPLVIKVEYYFGVKIWVAFLLCGIGLCLLSWLTSDIFWSSLFAVAGFSCFWSILEVFHQRRRVEKGWFPKNPKRKGR